MLTPATIWRAWNTAPSLLLSLAAMVLVYAWGMRRGRSRGGESQETSSRAFGRPAPDKASLHGAVATPSLPPTPFSSLRGPAANGADKSLSAAAESARLGEVPEGTEGVGERRSSRHTARNGKRLRPTLCFAGAVVTLIVALVSPLDALGDSLFTAHMIQHLLLMLVAAPLLVLSEYPLALVRALPRTWAQHLVRGLNRSSALRRAWDVLNIPAVAWMIFTIEMWAWHASSPYQAALRSETLHSLEHIGFVLSGMLFWWVLFRHTTAKHTQYGMAILYLFAASVQSGILGALMMFTSVPWYAFYASRAGAWGLTALQDQQLAGLIMWIPGGAVFNVLTIGYFAAWWRAMDERSKRQHLNTKDTKGSKEVDAGAEGAEIPVKPGTVAAAEEPEAR